MDRRSALATFLGKTQHVKKQEETPPLLVSSLTPYSGPWTFAEVAHLLRRTTFGPSYTTIKEVEALGMEATVDQLLSVLPMPDPPINFNFQNDPTTPIGESWVNKPLDNTIPNLNTSRNVSLRAWTIGLMNEQGLNIREKLVLFWHNHFVTAAITNSTFNFDYMDILRRNALGNFRTMTEEITVCSSMLLYLNGNENTRQAPNENYSRELLELFTIGKGEAAGPGDYTNYTEDDVVALAKALTGWRSRNIDGVENSAFVPNRHDTSDKQLSPRFNNVVISNEDEEEYKTVIDIILQQEETARFISRRLHIWFVGSNIDDSVESNVIEPMAALIRDNNYEIKPALEALFKSEYFYQESIRGCMVNHPIDFTFKLMNTFNINLSNNELLNYRVWSAIFRSLINMDMEIMGHPSVAGWKAFYQAPQYYDIWANSVSLPIRESLVDQFLSGFNVGQLRVKIDVLTETEKIENESEPNDLINGLATTIFPFPISQDQLVFLKEILIPGLPDFEWTIEYSEYLADPDNPDKREAVERKLNSLYSAMLKMPEFYLI
ncbi:MAG: DUF1800 domain-containing protein [Saprospiraceae bacterium]|nr:DUF1800 domain-containing protein [Saprospiraceae bacterium]